MIKNLGAKKLSRTGSHRRAMFANMATSLLLHEKVQTTLVKAKALTGFVDKIITDAKNGKHMEVRRIIRDKAVYKKLFEVIVPRYKECACGCSRVLKLGQRKGDATEIALVKLV